MSKGVSCPTCEEPMTLVPGLDYFCDNDACSKIAMAEGLKLYHKMKEAREKEDFLRLKAKYEQDN